MSASSTTFTMPPVGVPILSIGIARRIALLHAYSSTRVARSAGTSARWRASATRQITPGENLVAPEDQDILRE